MIACPNTSSTSNTPKGHLRRRLLTRLATLLMVGVLPVSSVLAEGQGPYQGIQKVEVFTHMDIPLQLVKNPPFELKVYRLDGYQRGNQAMDRLTPKGLSFAERQAWQKHYADTHKEFTDKWGDLAAEAVFGASIYRRYNSRGIVPLIVINERWLAYETNDVNKAIAAYRKQEHN